MVTVTCAVCGKQLEIFPTRAPKFRTCSRKCKGIWLRKLAPKVEKLCVVCKKPFKTKQSHLGRRVYCSKQCQGSAYATKYLAEHNPNYRGRTENWDGYPMKVDYKTHKTMPIHKAVVLEFLEVEKLGKNWTIHHRDCNVHNPVLENLAVLSRSDHKWLHKQFGNAGLWAYMRQKVSLDVLISWSNDPERARRLLLLNVTQQKGWTFSDLPTIHSRPEGKNRYVPDTKIREEVTRLVAASDPA